ncbi:MAG: hypothetical protein KBI41_05920 [Kiritimatiellae bacterium]|nr:hypothetical protein [Kiritimatiellia bacterium]MDD2349305.1 hypothetical protein [Kiritimatiellia bacterium]MDD3584815.1 hypothetical protein [Kiritimatiellia bacterium]HHU13828.1 hypothetical protein [Lentisphaerota bacterium]
MNDAVFQIMPLVICPIFMIVGIAIFRADPKKLLSWDRRTGYHIYKNKLKSTNDEARALRAAGDFYKFFGGCFFLFSLVMLLVAIGVLFLR